jgi:hypothetical protein
LSSANPVSASGYASELGVEVARELGVGHPGAEEARLRTRPLTPPAASGRPGGERRFDESDPVGRCLAVTETMAQLDVFVTAGGLRVAGSGAGCHCVRASQAGISSSFRSETCIPGRMAMRPNARALELGV